MFNNKKKCTEDTIGVIKKKRWNGDVWFLTVEYTVNGKIYNLKEQLKFQVTREHKIGNVPI